MQSAQKREHLQPMAHGRTVAAATAATAATVKSRPNPKHMHMHTVVHLSIADWGYTRGQQSFNANDAQHGSWKVSSVHCAGQMTVKLPRVSLLLSKA